MSKIPIANQNPFLAEKIRAYQRETPKARAIDIASALDCTEAEALSALAFDTWSFPITKLPTIWAHIQTWQRVMVLIRNQDAVSELEVTPALGVLGDSWLNWLEDDYNLHIRHAATTQILGLVRPGKKGETYSFNLVNQQGHIFCRFYTRTPSDTNRFLTFCTRYGTRR